MAISPNRGRARARLFGVAAAVALVVVAAATGASLLAGRHQATAAGPDTGSSARAVGEIYQLQAAFHRAKTNQDLDLMMSLWAPDATLVAQGDANSPYHGTEALRKYWSQTGSFKNRRLSLVPSFKTQIRVDGDSGYLYFECHDVGDYDTPARAIVNDTFLAGTVRRVGAHWLFHDMTSGKAPVLAADHYYFP